MLKVFELFDFSNRLDAIQMNDATVYIKYNPDDPNDHDLISQLDFNNPDSHLIGLNNIYSKDGHLLPNEFSFDEDSKGIVKQLNESKPNTKIFKRDKDERRYKESR